MLLTTWEIPVAFLIITALLLWFVVETKGRWLLKLALIVSVPMFSFVVWLSLSSYLGWTTPEKLPDKAFLAWGLINEPDLTDNDPGAIYLWIINIKSEDSNQLIIGYKPRPHEPRAHYLPYTRELHEKVEGALTIIKNGGTVVVENKKKGEGDGKGEGEEGEGEGKGNMLGKKSKRGGYRYSVETDIMFYELPPTEPQPKNHTN